MGAGAGLTPRNPAGSPLPASAPLLGCVTPTALAAPPPPGSASSAAPAPCAAGPPGLVRPTAPEGQGVRVALRHSGERWLPVQRLPGRAHPRPAPDSASQWATLCFGWTARGAERRFDVLPVSKAWSMVDPRFRAAPWLPLPHRLLPARRRDPQKVRGAWGPHGRCSHPGSVGISGSGRRGTCRAVRQAAGSCRRSLRCPPERSAARRRRVPGATGFRFSVK